MPSRKKALLASCLCMTLTIPTVSWAAFNGKDQGGVDTFESLGQFFIRLTKEAGEFFGIDDCPYGDAACLIESPVLKDSGTKVGRSKAFQEDFNNEALVCKEGNTNSCTDWGGNVKDKQLIFPPSFTEGPIDTWEVHTEILALNLRDASGENAVRAGMYAPKQGRSIGEVESFDNGDPGNFPAESFFNLRAEVDFKGKINSNDVEMTLYTKVPLTLVSEITDFPPSVVYIHESTNAVAVYDKETDMRIGGIVVAGHGTCSNPEPSVVPPFPVGTGNCVTIDEFTDIMMKELRENEMPFPLGIKLNSFTAKAKGNGQVAIEWVTDTEEDNATFQVWRANPLDGKCSNDPSNYINIRSVTPLVDSKGTSTQGATYDDYTDDNLTAGEIYCYALADTDFAGNTTYHLKKDEVAKVVAQ